MANIPEGLFGICKASKFEVWKTKVKCFRSGDGKPPRERSTVTFQGRRVLVRLARPPPRRLASPRHTAVATPRVRRRSRRPSAAAPRHASPDRGSRSQRAGGGAGTGVRAQRHHHRRGGAQRGGSRMTGGHLLRRSEMVGHGSNPCF